MNESRNKSQNNILVIDRNSALDIDLNKIQVAPQRMPEFVEFKALSLSERQALLEKLIKRVKSL